MPLWSRTGPHRSFHLLASTHYSPHHPQCHQAIPRSSVSFTSLQTLLTASPPSPLAAIYSTHHRLHQHTPFPCFAPLEHSVCGIRLPCFAVIAQPCDVTDCTYNRPCGKLHRLHPALPAHSQPASTSRFAGARAPSFLTQKRASGARDHYKETAVPHTRTCASNIGGHGSDCSRAAMEGGYKIRCGGSGAADA